MASGSFDITIDAANFDSIQINYPVKIGLSDSSGIDLFDATQIFTDLGANSKKIKVKNSSGTELYCEIEVWDDIAEVAVLHVKVDSISSTVDTELTLEWDSTWADNTTYVGDTGWLTGTSITGDDDFTGDDGDPPDSNLWDSSLADPNCTISSNALVSSSGSDPNTILSEFKLHGNFDIQCDYAFNTYPDTNYYISYLRVRFNSPSLYYLELAFGRYNLKFAAVNYFINGSATWGGNNTFNYASGKARLVRSGTSISGYIWNGSGWSLVKTVSNAVFSQDCSVEINYVRSVSEIITVDNFVINSGTVYVRGVADNLVSITTTVTGGATVTTSAATEVNSRSAILQGSLTDLGGESSVDVYFEYGLDTNYGSTTNALTMTSTGSFSARPTDLTEETTYHFRAAVTNGVDTWYSSDATLTTLEDPFQLTATPALTSVLWDWLDMSGPDGWSGDFITVGQDGWQDYTSLVSAAAAAQSGDTLLVYPGTYNETTAVFISKTLFITGMGTSPDDVFITSPAAVPNVWHTFLIGSGHNLPSIPSGTKVVVENMKARPLRSSGGALVFRQCQSDTLVRANKLNLISDGGTSGVVFFGDSTTYNAYPDYAGDAYLTHCTINRGASGYSMREVGTGSATSTISLSGIRYIGDYNCNDCDRQPSPHDYSNTAATGYGHEYGSLIVTDQFLAAHGYSRVTP